MNNFNLQNYREQLKTDLNLFDDFYGLIQALDQTQSMSELLDILHKILVFDSHQSQILRMTNDYWFPSTHWVTVAFAKCTNWASLSETNLALPNGQKVAELHFLEWPNATFRFVKAPLVSGGYYLEETAQNLRVLYWDIERKRFYLDTQQFAQLVQTEAIQLAGVRALSIFQKRLTAIAMQLSEEAYDLVLPGLSPLEQTNLPMNQKGLPASVLDSLFISAAKQQVILKRIKAGPTGVEFQMSGIGLQLTQHQTNNGYDQWTYDIIDSNKEVTIYTLFQQLPFFYQWYYNHFTLVGLKDKREVFVE